MKVIATLKEKGFFIEPLNQGSSLLKVSCINFPDFRETDLEWLQEIREHIVILDLSRTKINDQVFEFLVEFKNLTILKLNQTLISGTSLKRLHQCVHLNQLHLTETEVGLENIKSLNGHPKLEKVFAYKTPASLENKTKDEFTFDVIFGDFELPTLPTDTITF